MTTNSPVVGTAEVQNMLDVSRATLYRILGDDKTFPKPFKISLRKNAWLRVGIEAWINTRAGVAA